MSAAVTQTGGLDLVIRASRCVTGGEEHPCSVGIRDGRIAAVDAFDALTAATEMVLADDEVLLPGMVDTHVHVNEPGRTAWEGFASATRAAAAGGVTTIVDMPLNSIPPTCSVAALEVKQAVARDQVYVDVGFWGGAVPENVSELAPLQQAGVFGFKCFLSDSGVPEFGHVGPAELLAAMREIASFDGLLIAHAEDPDVIAQAPLASGVRYDDFLASRPDQAEDIAIGRLIDAARVTGCRVHVVHLSSAMALERIEAARADGVRLTVETCPHYLTLDAAEISDGATSFKCCPPVRNLANRNRLWRALRQGTIDSIVSDHSPCTADLKHLDVGDFGTAWGGIASLQIGLPVVWTTARELGLSLADVTNWMSTAPAALIGLTSKGAIEVGRDADLVAFAPDEVLTVDATKLFHRNAITAYDGKHLRGEVRATWLRGYRIAEGGKMSGEPAGRLLYRGENR